jgi:hypothetical protein
VPNCGVPSSKLALLMAGNDTTAVRNREERISADPQMPLQMSIDYGA